MTDPLKALIEALRHELQQYGEMLARLDQQQESIMSRAADDVLASVAAVQSQGVAIQEARRAREYTQRELAGYFHQPEETTLGDLTERMPSDYRPLVRALVEENNQLLARVHQRARQNHLLLRRSLDLM
ncbi:MAG TPA: flagellar export chaperone FlgN, partial [Clostridia bacterium]|nr:flagellar export chaperone FlgN [Clostridia bacterium]